MVSFFLIGIIGIGIGTVVFSLHFSFPQASPFSHLTSYIRHLPSALFPALFNARAKRNTTITAIIIHMVLYSILLFTWYSASKQYVFSLDTNHTIIL